MFLLEIVANEFFQLLQLYIMSSDAQVLNIIMGTTSVLKTEAVKSAFEQGREVFEKQFKTDKMVFKITGTNVKSGVNEQPIGWKEIITGANNRAKNALDMIGSEVKPRLVVAIENGIIEIPENGPGYWMDIAWVALIDVNTGKKYNASSTSVHVPTEVVEATISNDPKKFTIGDLLHARDPSISKKEPHSSLLANITTRVSLMQQAVLSCVGQWIFDLSKQEA